MAEIVNLRLARKRKRRAAGERAAGENRIRFGRAKAQRRQANLEAERERRIHEGLRLDDEER
jgi:Domain of unknown function (DUF4169)